MFFLDGFFTYTYLFLWEFVRGRRKNLNSREFITDTRGSRWLNNGILEINVALILLFLNYFVLTNQITLSNKLLFCVLFCCCCCRILFIVYCIDLCLSHVRTNRSTVNIYVFVWVQWERIDQKVRAVAWVLRSLSLCFLSFARCARERNHERERNAILSEREMFRCKEQTLRFDAMHQFEIVLKFTETKVFVF